MFDKKKTIEQLYKVSNHELGYTHDIPHCYVKSYYMRVASGDNSLDKELGFCISSKDVMENKG